MRNIFMGVLLAVSPFIDAIETPNLGKVVSNTFVKKWNGDIFPNGEGLPIGKGTALYGKKVYQHYCQSCHGKEGTGASAEELAGAKHGLKDNPPDKTIGTYWPYATTLFDFTRRAMPLDKPNSLKTNQLYAVTAYLLHVNGIIGENEIMNERTLPLVKMPNQEGFIPIYH
jgi:cytochrome c